MNIFEELREDHKTQRVLLEQLVETSGDSKLRDSLFKQLIDELKVHADAEERFFYKPLFSHDHVQGRARHSVAEHKEIDDIIQEMIETEYSSPKWLQLAKLLKHQVEHHLDEEEHEVFQMAGKSLTEKQKKDLAGSYRNMMDQEKTKYYKQVG